MKKIKTIEMELALASYFKCYQNLIVTNCSWGLYLKNQSLHECDLLICTKSNFLWEVEIKVSKQDLIKDKEKWHNHEHPAIKRLYFAIPKYLENCIEHIPERAGIIIVSKTEYSNRYHCTLKRNPKNQKGYKLLTEEKLKMALLGSMRIWGLKRKICGLQ